jgi:uncharacterized protein YjbJ (UPF0337 family)
MSDVSSGARAPDGAYGTEPAYPAATYAAETYPAETYSAETYPAETYPATDGDDSKAKQVAGQAKESAGQAASDVKDTAAEQVQRVGAEAKNQVRSVASDVRDRVTDQAHTQNDKLVSSIRQTADQLDEMRGDRENSPAATVVTRVADGGRQLADYLDKNGPEGVLREVQDFARRRPGAFLATALAAGFVVGRLGKGVAKADPEAGESKPAGDAFVSSEPAAGYSSTEYASTGTGTPVVVEEEYLLEYPEDRR